MSTVIVLSLGVGSTTPGTTSGPVSLAEAVEAVGFAEAAGVPIIRIQDQSEDGATLDPSVVASYLAGRFSWASFLVEAATTHNAPYNLARRILSLDRATAGRAGIALRPGGGDEVSAATVPDPTASDACRRWAEYADILVGLWESFPSDALVGDQEAGVFVEDSLISPIDHEGRFYRVAGPLDGPSSVQGRPVVVADVGELDWTSLARRADAVVVTAEQSAGADAELSRALAWVDRRRDEVALLGRTTVAAVEAAAYTADRLTEWADRDGLDGFELVPVGGLPAWTAVVSRLVPLLDPDAGAGSSPTLRSVLRLPDLAEVRR
jgi:alkanesulfonate monooxygenase SsuD/methylene tetrahydromethanopterin reductase-like flavin-dependent oxidoreductase (luciferase family)